MKSLSLRNFSGILLTFKSLREKRKSCMLDEKIYFGTGRFSAPFIVSTSLLWFQRLHDICSAGERNDLRGFCELQIDFFSSSLEVSTVTFFTFSNYLCHLMSTFGTEKRKKNVPRNHFKGPQS